MGAILKRGDKAVLTTVGTHGDLFPYLSIGLALKARGVDVVIATADLYQSEVLQRGLRFAHLSPSTEEIETNLGETVPALMGRAMHKVSGPKFAVTKVVMPYLERNVAELEAACTDAQVLISHPYSFAAPLVAERIGIPWRSVFLQPLPLLSPYDPAVISELVPLHLLQPLLGPRLYAKVLALGKATTRSWVQPVEELRAKLGMGPSPGHPLFEGSVSPHGSFAMFDPVLLRDTRGLPPRMEVVGFSHADGGDGSLPEELELFLQRNASPRVFTLGTSAVHNPGRFYEMASAAAAELRAPAVFLAGGYQFKRPLPPEQIAVYWASHAALFPRASAVVHQGGMGTCFQALRAAVPQLVVPFANDQPDNARRLKHLSVALSMNSWLATTGKLRRRLHRLATDQSFRANAVRVRERMLTDDGAKRVADLLTGDGEPKAGSYTRHELSA